MWEKRFSKVYPGISKESLWAAWEDVNNWPRWDSELEYCDLKEQFIAGSQFILKPLHGPKVKLVLSEVVRHKKFTDYCKFVGAIMYDAHELQEEKEGLRITNTITVKGPLSFVWAKLVAKNVAASVPTQTDSLVEYVRDLYE